MARWLAPIGGSALVPLVILVAVTASACGAAGRSDPVGTAAAADRAVAFGDWAALCALLSPGVRADVAGEQTCTDAMIQDSPAANGSVTAVRTIADQAQVRQDQHAMFLQWADGRWWVTALDCTLASGDLMYRCSVKG